MVRVSRLIGLPVVSLECNERIGIIREIWLTKDLCQILGFSVDLRRWISSVRFLPFANLFSLSSASLSICSENAIERGVETDDWVGFHDLVSSVVRMRDGTVVGSLSDLFADENTGRILELEVSEGLIQDITKGRSRIEKPAYIGFTGEALILHKDSENDENLGP